MINIKRKKGFSLIELILVLSLSSLAFISMIQWEVKKTDITRAENAGEQFAEVGKALSAYIAKEQVNLAYILSTDNKQEMSIEVLKGTASGPFVPHQFLPATFSSVNLFGVNYVIEIRKTPEGRIEGIVTTDTGICEKGNALTCPSVGNPIKYDWIGAAMRKIGPQSGVSREVSTGVFTLMGYNAGWTATGDGATTPDFDTVNAAGKIAYRVSSTDTSIYDAQYLRLDGTSTMLGNLNMGNYSIENATNISYNGWLQGFGILANTIRSGTIYNTGDIQTNNLYATGIVKVGNASLPTTLTAPTATGDAIEGGDLIADKEVYAKDIYLGDNINSANRTRASQTAANRVIPNVWLSDLLPKYSSRGIYKVDDADIVTKPNCNGNGVGKIEVIPQNTFSHGRVLGENYLYDETVSMTEWKMNIFWDLVSYNPTLAWANDNGDGTWTVRFDTSKYSGYTMTDEFGTSLPLSNAKYVIPNWTMSGLAHIYCDYNF